MRFFEGALVLSGREPASAVAYHRPFVYLLENK
jgi:hypothetical protein